MKAIILCAGYATRLYPITVNKPKSLLPVAGKPVINYIIEKIEECRDIDEIFVVTNNKFYENFKSWFEKFKEYFNTKIWIVNDNTNDNEARLGGVGDLWFTINEKNIDDDFLVIAGDNLFDFSLKDVVNFFKEHKKLVNIVYELDKEEAKRFGVVELTDKKIVGFEEKPENPKSNLISLAIYLFPKSYLRKVEEYMKTNFNKGGVGYLLKYLIESEEILAYISKGKFFDVGNLKDYKKANKTWSKDDCFRN